MLFGVQVLESALQAFANFAAPFRRIGPRGGRCSVRIQQGQGLFRVLARQVSLAERQIRIGKVDLCVSGVRIGEHEKLKNLGRSFRLTRAQMIRTDDVHRNFREQLRRWIFLPGFLQLPGDLGDSSGHFDLPKDGHDRD